MKAVRYVLIVAAASVMCVLGACENKNKTTNKSAMNSSSSTVSMGAVNDKCPLSGEAVNKNAPVATYQGKTVGFCCAGCAARFNAMSDAQKSEMLAKVSKK